MERVPVSKRLRKELEKLLEGVDSREPIVSEIMKKGTAIILRELIEQEVAEFLGIDHYERRKDGKTRAGYQNGYESLKVKNAEGSNDLSIFFACGLDYLAIGHFLVWK